MKSARSQRQANRMKKKYNESANSLKPAPTLNTNQQTSENEVKRSRTSSNDAPSSNSKAASIASALLQEAQEETINFEAMVQGQLPASTPTSPVVEDRKVSDKSSVSQLGNIEAKSTSQKLTEVFTPNGKNTLFHHGFKLHEQLKSASSKVRSYATSTKGKSTPTKEEQDAFVEKHGEANFVSGIGINCVKVEDGTFARMDAAENKDRSIKLIVSEDIHDADKSVTGELKSVDQTEGHDNNTASVSELKDVPNDKNLSDSTNNETVAASGVLSGQSMETAEGVNEISSRSTGSDTAKAEQQAEVGQDTASIKGTAQSSVGNSEQKRSHQLELMNSNTPEDLGDGKTQVVQEATGSRLKDSNTSFPSASPTDDIEFPPNDDNLQEEPKKAFMSKPSASVRKPRARDVTPKKSTRHQYQYQAEEIEISDEVSEDSQNTIDSNEASFNMTEAEGTRQVPPTFIRYRVGITLDNVDLILNTTSDATETISPSDRFKDILKDLSTCVYNLDNASLLVTQKNSPTFKVISTNPTSFPTRVETIASFFDGYKSKLKEGVKKFFQFCVHSPTLSNSKLESELVEWGRVHSHVLFECNLQAETSKTIGWLVYSMPFTNTTFLKSYLKGITGHEWGFKFTTFTESDKKVDWKLRLKALEVMVPAEHEHAARALISSTFKQRPSRNTYKSFTECYIYVGNEREHKEENMAAIFLELVGRHKFQLTYVDFVPISILVKSIDNKIALKDKKTFLSIREMILNLPSRDTKYGVQKLFQSVDFVPDPKKVWFNKVRGEGSACYYLTYYKWAEGEALHTAEGLGVYLGKHFGIEGIYSSFSADHWKFVQSWKWNIRKNKFDTPQEMNLAENVMYDPTATIMKAVQDDHIQQESEQSPGAPTDDPLETAVPTEDADDVNVLNNDPVVRDSAPAPYVYDENTAHLALEIARSIQSASSMSASNSSAESPTLSQLAMKRAAEIAQGQADEDCNSVGMAGTKMNHIHQVFQHDDVSTTSSMTDITNNTANNTYHHTVNDNASVASYDTSLSLRSLNDTALAAYITPNMSTEQLEQSIDKAIKDNYRKNQRKANMYLANLLKEQRTQGSQSVSNCDAEEEE